MNETEQTERERWQHLTWVICDDDYAKSVGCYKLYQNHDWIFPCCLLLFGVSCIGFLASFANLFENLVEMEDMASASFFAKTLILSLFISFFAFWPLNGSLNVPSVCFAYHVWDDDDPWEDPNIAYWYARYTLNLASKLNKLGFSTDSWVFRAGVRYLHGFYSIEIITAFHHLGVDVLSEDPLKAQACLKVARLLSGKE